jgi:hypothetical protein
MPVVKFAAKSVKKSAAAKKKPRKPSTAAEKAAAAHRMRRVYNALSPAERAERRWRQCAKPPQPRAGSRRAENMRVSAVSLAYCDWSDVDEVFRMYVAAAVMTELFGELYVVDHIVPLQNPFVCGLHTHTNMQVITSGENYRKSNWLWPQMPPIDWSCIELIEQQDRLEAANDEQDPRPAARERRARA